ncbi:transposase [Merismopedia glauca]|uniref:transposase n=1 Tax=Merismopedia glauca TaxID=292586 RepID=UPI001C638B37|nr:transposase [Merismopedia glauca]
MKGTKDYKMHNCPFTLLQVVVSDETDKPLWKPIWLIVMGNCREQICLLDCYEAYRQRYDLEHLFRFGKQRLLMNSYSTPSTHHEENWFQLTLLAYVNLWVFRKLAVILPRPWEYYLTQDKSLKITPSLVQRDFGRIISQMGIEVNSPKRRGYSPGRIKGTKQVPRPRYQVIKKSTPGQKVS